MASSLEGSPIKAKETPSHHELRLAPLDTNPVFQCLGEKLHYFTIETSNKFHECKKDTPEKHAWNLVQLIWKLVLWVCNDQSYYTFGYYKKAFLHLKSIIAYQSFLFIIFSNLFFIIRKFITHNFLSLIFLTVLFHHHQTSSLVVMLFFFLLLSCFLNCSFSLSPRISPLFFSFVVLYFAILFFSSPKLSAQVSFLFSQIFVTVLFHYDLRYHIFLFYFVIQFLICYFFIDKVITHNFVSFFLIFS